MPDWPHHGPTEVAPAWEGEPDENGYVCDSEGEDCFYVHPAPPEYQLIEEPVASVGEPLSVTMDENGLTCDSEGNCFYARPAVEEPVAIVGEPLSISVDENGLACDSEGNCFYARPAVEEPLPYYEPVYYAPEVYEEDFIELVAVPTQVAEATTTREPITA